MSDNVISYIEMCLGEGTSLQAGMNFGLGGNHSVILMSVRPKAPYRDRLEDGGTTLIYEGHNQPKGRFCANPKVVDQPARHSSGSPTQNGKFYEAAQLHKLGKGDPKRVRVYETFVQVSGHITVCSISSIHGKSKINSEKFSSSNLSPSKAMRISPYGPNSIFNVAALSPHL